MNAMNIPGFTADSSLYKTNGRYQMNSSTHRVELNASLVQPSLAIYMDGRFVCDGEVTDNGFINCDPIGGGGGGGGVDRVDRLERLACARCYTKCNRKPVTQRAACRAQCDDDVC